MKKKKTKELLLLFLLFLLCGALFAIRHFTASSKNSIKITVCGREQGIYDLSCDQIIRIGETNVCEIRDGQVRMIEADCPDQLCIKQGAFGADGGMIVCLPNRVVIEPASSTRTDAVSYRVCQATALITDLIRFPCTSIRTAIPGHIHSRA